MLGRLILGFLLSLQISPADLEKERLATIPSTETNTLFVVIATYPDGIGVNKAQLSCSGYWYTPTDNQEQTELLWAPWRQTDSRGARVFTLSYLDESEEFTCRAEKDGLVGSVTFSLYKTKTIIRLIIQ